MSNIKDEKIQVSESILNSMLLALSGGFQDAYTYNIRDHVFSNAQTGNVVLFSQNLITGNFTEGMRYILPILAFACGIFIVEQIENRFQDSRILHWRQKIVLAQMLIMLVVGFISTQYNSLANILVSFSCAMQVQTFRTVNGYSYASTMCIGNLRSAIAALSAYTRKKEHKQLVMSLHYIYIILMFAIGAGTGGFISVHVGIRAIWGSSILLLFSFLLMFKKS